MKTLPEQLSQYASYHRNDRNLQTHLLGIPLILFSVLAILSRPVLLADPFPISPAFVVALAALIFYFVLDVGFGVIMAVVFVVNYLLAQQAACLATTAWLSISFSAFMSGWIFQLVGHHFEGRKPAFLDDVMGLIIGPLFIAAELVFRCGFRKDLRDDIERRLVPEKKSGAGL